MARAGMAAMMVVVAWCALVVAAAVHVPRLVFDNDTWLPSDNILRLELEGFQAEFEPHETLLVVIELEQDFFEPAQTEKIQRLDSALAALPETRSVLSPLSATTIIDTGGTLEIGSFGNALQNNFLANATAYEERFLGSPYAGKLLSDDRRAVLLRVAIARDDSLSRAAAVAAVAATVRDHGYGSNTPAPRFAGEAALKNELNRATREQLPLLLALAAVVLAVFLRAACGNWRRAALIFAAAAAAVASCLGIMAVFSWPMNAVLLMLPVMVAVIAVADGLHILASWDALAVLPDNKRLSETVRQSWLPCLGATVTSAAGFGAFALSELAPLRHFGNASALAILYAYPLITGALWGGLWLFPSLTAAPPQRLDWARLVAAIERLGGAFPRRVAAVTIGIALLLGGGLGLIRTETNFLSVFFAGDSTVRGAFDLVDERLGGSGRVEVVLRGAQESFATVAGMREVEALSQRFAGIATVNHVESYLLPVAMTDRAFGGSGRDGNLPQSDQALSQALLFLSLSRNETERGVLSPYLDFNHGGAHLSLQTPNLNSPQLRETIALITAATATTANGAIQTTVTGFGVFIHNLGEYVLRTQALSILLTLLIIGALLLAQFGVRAGLCGLAANLLPLAATTGLVAWLGYPYDFATILIAGVTLGLSVDNTIHFLHHYRRRYSATPLPRPNGGHPRNYALQRTARPIAVTTALFCCGLAVVAFSDLVVLRRFAVFTAFGMGAALASVLLFLPAILAMVFPRSTLAPTVDPTLNCNRSR